MDISKERKTKMDIKRSEIIQRYMDGETVISISKDKNLSRERVYQYLRKTPNWKKIRSDKAAERKQKIFEKASAIYKEYASGTSLKDLAKKHKVTVNFMRVKINKYRSENF